MNADDQAAVLRLWATGSPADAAAVELLVGHGLWVRRMAADPGGMCVDSVGDVDWVELAGKLRRGELAASGSELSILRLACSLLGVLPVDLDQCLSGLDEDNLRLVLEAVARANGRPGAMGVTGGAE